MKKRLLSLVLCLTMVITTLTGITFQVAATDDGLTLIDQKFYDDSTGTAVELTEAPDGWTVTGSGYSWRTTGFSPGHNASVGAAKIHKDTEFDTNGAEYTFSVDFRHMSNTQYIHWGASNTADASKTGIADTGYTFTATMLSSGTNAYKSGVYKLYKNGTQLDVDLTDVSTSYGFQKNRTFNFKVTSTGIEISGAAFNGTITVEDKTPITQGYVGASLSNNNVGSLANCALGFMKLVKPLVVDEKASNVIPKPVVQIDGEGDITPVKIAFNAPLDKDTVNTDNAYLKDENGTQLTSGYSVALEGDGTIVFTPLLDEKSGGPLLKYKTTYKAVVATATYEEDGETLKLKTTGIKSTGGIALGESKEYEFVTETPPFEVMTKIDGTDVEFTADGTAVDLTSLADQAYTFKHSVSNTIGYYENTDKAAYLIMSFEDASGKVYKTIARKVKIPSLDDEGEPLQGYVSFTGDDENVDIPNDATVLRSYILTANLDNYHPRPADGSAISDATVNTLGDTVTVSGTAGTESGKDVYLMMMNMETASSAYEFDTSVEFEDDISSTIQKVAKTTTGENGAYTFTIPMNVSGATAADWRFYIGGDSISTAHSQTFYFVNSEAKRSTIADINGVADANAMLDVLEDADIAKTLGIEGNTLIAAFEAEDTANANSVLMTALAERLYNVKTAGAFDETDGGVEFINAINEQAIYVAIEKEMTELVFDNGAFTAEADSVLGFDALDDADSRTFTQVFESDFTAEAQTVVLNAFMGNSYSSAEAVYDVFKSNVMVYGFIGGVIDVTGFVKANAGEFGIDLTDYNTLDIEQTADVNTALAAATLDATSVETVRTSIQGVIDRVISNFDLSIYSYTFSSLDTTLDGSTTASGWVTSGGGSFNDDKGYVASSTGTYSIMSPVDRTVSGDYVLSVIGSKSYNTFNYFFNYIDGSNHSYVSLTYNDSSKATITKLYTNGSLIATGSNVSGQVVNVQVIVEDEGYVTVKSSTGAEIIPRTYVGSTLEGGRFGAGLKDTPGNIQKITVKKCLEIDNLVESGNTDMEDTAVASTFTGTFNYPVNSETVTTDTVKILDADGNVIEGAVKSAAVSNDGLTLTVEVNPGALDYKSVYYLNLTTDIQFASREDSFASEVKAMFNTEDPDINITSFYDKVGSESMLFTNDITTYREVYTKINSLTMVTGQSPMLYMVGENNGDTEKTVKIYITIEDGNKVYLVSNGISVTLGAGESGWITPSGFNSSETMLTTITIPDDVSADAKVKFYVIEDESKITTAYPYVVNAAVAGDEKPSFELAGAELTVEGKTPSYMADKVVNMFVIDSNGAIKVIASTKTTDGGAYTFNVDLATEFITSGEYHIYVGGQDYAARLTPVNEDNTEKTFTYVDDGDRNALIATINGATNATTIFDILNNDASLEALGLNSNKIIMAMKAADAANGDNALITALAEKIYTEKGTDDFAEDGGEDLRSRVAIISVFAAIENNFTAAIVDAEGQFTAEADAVLGFDALDAAEPVSTFTTVFETELSAEKRNAVLLAVMGNAYADAAAAYAAFADAVMVNALNDSNVDIDELLYDNEAYYGLTLDDYELLNDSQLALIHATILATTFDINDVAGSIQTFINNEIKNYDLSVYEYTFSSADAVSTEWSVSSGGIFSDESGYTSEKNSDGVYPTRSLYSPLDLTFDGDYLFTSDICRSSPSNSVIYYFDYVDGNNYGYVTFNISQGIVLARKQGGTDTTYKTASEYVKSGNTYGNYEKNAQIIVEKEGYVTVKSSDGTVYIDRTYVGGALNGGRVGIQFKDVIGSVKTVSVKKFLTLNNVVESGQADLADTELAPVFTGRFNYPVNADTINTDNIKIYSSKYETDAEGNIILVPGAEIPGAVEAVALSADRYDLTVTVKPDVLNYKTDYYLNLTTGIEFLLRAGASFPDDRFILFNTKAAGFDITSIEGKTDAGETVFTRDVSRYAEIYNATEALTTKAGSDVKIFMEGTNTTGESKALKIYVTVEDTTKTYMVNPVSVTLPESGSGFITTTGFVGLRTPLTTITVPTDVSEDAVVKLYIFEDNADKIVTVYPYVANAAAADNGERPSFALAGSELTVQGKTLSGLAGKVVNMIITNSANEAMAVATTLTTEGGAYSFAANLATELYNSGEYHIYIGGQDYAGKVTPVKEDNTEKTFTYVDDDDRNLIISTINNAATADEIVAILTNDAYVEALGLNSNSIIIAMKAADAANGNNDHITALAERIRKEKAVDDFAEDGGEELKSRVAIISVYAAIEKGLSDVIVDAEGQFTAEADTVLGFDALDAAEPTSTFTTVFETELSAEKKTAVLSNVMGKSYNTANEVYTDFANAVMVNALADENVDINKLLLDNETYFGLDLADYKLLKDEEFDAVHSAMRTAAYDINDVAGSIQTILNALLKNYDLSVFEYTFSSADTIVSGNTTPTGWYVNQPSGREGTFSDENGYVVTSTDDKHKNAHYLISPADRIASGDYVLSATGSRSYQYFRYFFNYKSSSETCEVAFLNETSVTLSKDGQVIYQADATYHNKFSGAQIIVEEEGYVTVKTSSGDVIIPRTYVGSTLDGGRFGAGLEHSPGTVKTISVKNYLTLNNVVESGQADIADTELAPVFTGTFGYPVNASKANTDTIKIYSSKYETDADGNTNLVPDAEIVGAIEEVALSADGYDLTVKVKPGILDYKTDYYLNVSTGVKMLLRADGTFFDDQFILFNTKDPEFDISSLYGTTSEGESVFTRDMLRYVELYDATADLTTKVGSNINLYMEGSNNTGAEKTVKIYITLEDGSKSYAIVPVTATLANGESGWITSAGFANTATPIATLTIPAEVTANAKVKYYVIEDEDKVTTAYPYVANVSVDDNGDRPIFSLIGDELVVKGKTNSNLAGKEVNMIIAGPSSETDAKIVATTVSTEGGAYTFRVTLNSALCPSGSYNIYIGGQDYAAKVSPVNADGSTKQLVYNDAEDRQNIVGIINNAKNESVPNVAATILNTIETNKDALGFDSVGENGVNLYEVLKAKDNSDGNTINMTAIATKVANKTGNFDTTDGADEFIKFVREAMAIQIYTAGLANVAYGSNGEFVLNDIVKLPEVDGTTTTNGTNTAVVDAYEKYKNVLSNAGKAQVRNALLNNSYIDTTTGVDKLKEKFIQEVIIASLVTTNVETEGAGHITDIIINNGIAAGITDTYYNQYVGLSDGVNSINSSLLITNVSNIDTLNTTLNSLMNPSSGSGGAGGGAPSTPPSGGVGSQGGSGSSVTIAGGSTIMDAEASMKYVDLAGFEWAEEAISHLAKEGVVSGDGNGSFRPGDRVKREELMKMALYGMDISINNYVSSTFTDADKSHWAYKFIATAEEKGFTTGRGDGTFGFGEDITREEVATILYRIMVALGKAEKVDNKVLNSFGDKGDVSDYAVDAVSFMVDNGIINGVEADVLAPKSYCTRAQVAKMVYGVMNYLNK